MNLTHKPAWIRMRRNRCVARLGLLFVVLGGSSSLSFASTIDSSDKYAYSANGGWINLRHDQPAAPAGITVAANFLSGFAHSANCGWIHFGDGSPDDGIAYGNDSDSDFGVNHDGAGRLTGLAYGANIGWITFEQTFGMPRINLQNGAFTGYAYSANCGWINLGTGTLVTDMIEPGADTDGDGIADSWELEKGAENGTPDDLALLGGSGDADSDGVSDTEEYVADTNPFLASDYLRIIDISFNSGTDDNLYLEWTSSNRRVYDILETKSLEEGFQELPGLSGLPGIDGTTAETFTQPLANPDFFRVVARLPLTQDLP